MTINVTIEVATYTPLVELLEARDLIRTLISMRGVGEQPEGPLQAPARRTLDTAIQRATEPVGFETKVEEDFNKQTETTGGASVEADPSKATETLAPPPAAPAKPRGRPAKPPVAKTYTIDEIRAVLVEKSKAGIEAIEKQRFMLNSMGYEKLSEVPIERYAELMEKAQAL